MWARSATAPHRVVSGDGVANSRIATALGISRPTVLDWRARFRTEGLDSVGAVRPGRGRKPEITADQVQAIVHETPEPGQLATVSAPTGGAQPEDGFQGPVGALFASTGPAASTGQPATGLIRVPQSDHHFDPRSPSAEKCPDRAQERHDAVRWCRLGSTDSAEEPEIVVARAIGGSNDEKPIP
jgi:hypothetical protein